MEARVRSSRRTGPQPRRRGDAGSSRVRSLPALKQSRVPDRYWKGPRPARRRAAGTPSAIHTGSAGSPSGSGARTADVCRSGRPTPGYVRPAFPPLHGSRPGMAHNAGEAFRRTAQPEPAPREHGAPRAWSHPAHLDALAAACRGTRGRQRHRPHSDAPPAAVDRGMDVSPRPTGSRTPTTRCDA